MLEGLDTYATVKVNGHCVLSTHNMFRQWRQDVRAFVQLGENQLEITFRSPIAEDIPKLERLGYALPAPNDQSEADGLADKKSKRFRAQGSLSLWLGLGTEAGDERHLERGAG